MRAHKTEKVKISKKELLIYYDEFIEELQSKRKAQNTLTQYKTSLDQFFNFLNEEQITEIDLDTLNSFIDYLENDFFVYTYKKHKKGNTAKGTKKGQTRKDENGNKIIETKEHLKKSTINTRITVLNRFTNWIGIPEFKLDKKVIENAFYSPLTEQEYENLLDWCDILTDPTERNKSRKRKIKQVNCSREKLILKILKNTGIRIQELAYFTVKNLKAAKRERPKDQEGNRHLFYLIPVTNKGKTRDVYIPEALYKEILKYAEQNGRKEDQIIFCSKNDPYKLLDKSNLWKKIKYIASKSNVKHIDGKIKLHAFRHLFAIDHYKKNKDISKLQKLLGHKDIKTTTVYIDWTAEDLAKSLIND